MQRLRKIQKLYCQHNKKSSDGWSISKWLVQRSLVSSTMSIACLFKKSGLYVKVLSEIESREKLQKFGVIIKALFKNFQGTNLKL